MKRKSDRYASGKAAQGELHTGSGAETLAAAVFDFVAADPGRLMRFMETSGLSPEGLRAAAAGPDLLVGILDHVVADEDLLLACARSLAVPPERIVTAWRRLGPPDPDSFGA
ncbi:DUF3572 domain-containing protein [Methylobacterium oryzisoli]|uniref:DUF3572 domain-containing protein n=1 Tax=Methylobacterium oryzisoli TaxID=3385502 RepID=UPI0038929195